MMRSPDPSGSAAGGQVGRTAVNVIGNCVAAVVVARWEGVFDDRKMREPRAA